jgi:hypothetical protein
MWKPSYRRALTCTLAAACGIVAGAVLISPPASAAVLFSDDFEQPTYNVWLGASGGNWSVVSEDGSKVFKQSNATLAAPTAWAGGGSEVGTVVTARVKPTSPLTPSNLVSLAGRVANPSNLYYVGLRGTGLEIGQQAWGQNVVLASVPFAASVGTWYTLSLSFLTPGTVTGTVTGPAGVSATVSAADPGGPAVGDRVALFTRTASASFDDIRLTNTLPEPAPPTGPCPVAITMKVGINYGNQFTATVSFRNTSSTTIPVPWTMTWRFTSGQTILGLFNGTWYQVGPLVTLKSTPWFPPTPPGANSGVTIGFTASAPIAAPTDATFNGYPCALTFS